MKRTFAGIAAAVLVMQSGVLAQAILKPSEAPITIHAIDNAANNILPAIARAGEISIRGGADFTQALSQPITIHLQKVTVEEALSAVLSAANLTYTVVDEKTIQLVRR